MKRLLAMHMCPAIAHAAGVTTLFAALLVLPAAQSQAFHDSQMDPPTKQFLAGIIDRMQQLCDKGDGEACRDKEEVRAFGNALVQAEQACAAGYREGCQSRAVFREVVRSLKARLGTPLGELPGTLRPRLNPSLINGARPLALAPAHRIDPGAQGECATCSRL